jgi:hypothetical protein
MNLNATLTAAVLSQRFVAADVEALLLGFTPLPAFQAATTLAQLQARAAETRLPRLPY